MRAELKRLHRQLQTTTIYVTHDQEEAMTLGDRIVIMKDGVIQQVGAPLDVFLEGGVVQPDLVILCDLARQSDRGIEGAPDLVLEILSPRTASRDLNQKRWLYETPGVPEYLIVDPARDSVLVLRLAEGRYRETARLGLDAVLPLLGGALPVQLDPALPDR